MGIITRMSLGIGDLVQLAGAASEEKGFHNPTVRDTHPEYYYGQKLALIHSEVSEALEELRAGYDVDYAWYSGGDDEKLNRQSPYTGDGKLRKPEGVPSELADIVIRVADMAYEAGIDLGDAIEEKIAYNRSRAAMHGKAF